MTECTLCRDAWPLLELGLTRKNPPNSPSHGPALYCHPHRQDSGIKKMKYISLSIKTAASSELSIIVHLE